MVNILTIIYRTYEEGRQALKDQEKQSEFGTVPHVDDAEEEEDEVDENEFNLKGSVIYQPFNSTDNLRALSGKKNGNVEDPGTLMRARTSSQLVDMAKDAVHEDQQKIADFI